MSGTLQKRKMLGGFSSHWVRYWAKWRGGKAGLPKTPPFRVLVWTFIGSTLGLGVVSLIHFLALPETGFGMLIGSFGATAVLVYACPESPLAQPWNCIGGHFVSAVVGITVSLIHNTCCSQPTLWIAATFSVSLAITAMQITRSVHPPGGATALIAVTLPRTNVGEGYVWVFLPTVSGITLLVLVAIIVNNFSRDRIYPAHWRTLFSPAKPPTVAVAAVAAVALSTPTVTVEPVQPVQPVDVAVDVPEGMEEALRESDGAINEGESAVAHEI